MSATPETITDIARAIQLALAPAFLLTGIAAMLNVMTGRLARIIDRGRALSEGRRDGAASTRDRLELQGLEKRRHFTSVAITACTVAALLLCMVIASLFLEVVLNARLGWLIGTLFTATTLALVAALSYFLREVHMATGTIRIAAPAAHEDDRDATS